MEIKPTECIGDYVISERRIILQLENGMTLADVQEFVDTAMEAGMHDTDQIFLLNGHNAISTVRIYGISVAAGDWAYELEKEDNDTSTD